MNVKPLSAAVCYGGMFNDTVVLIYVAREDTEQFYFNW